MARAQGAAPGLNPVAPAIREYLKCTGDAALVIRLADLLGPDEGNEYVPAE